MDMKLRNEYIRICGHAQYPKAFQGLPKPTQTVFFIF